MTQLLLTATTSTSTTSSGTSVTNLVATIVPLVLMIAIFYFFLIRPESKRKKETQSMLSALTVGDEVTTIGGIIGRISSIKDDEITLETGADHVRIRIQRNAIANKKEIIHN